MLFTTATFVLVYLPIVLAGYFQLGQRSPLWAAVWLFGASVFFYGYWMPVFTGLLLLSVAVNFFLGTAIARERESLHRLLGLEASRTLCIAGIAFNLGLLGYFKYANFFIDNLNVALGVQWRLGEIILPIGISFYSFTQIAFLVDTAQGKVAEFRAVHYGLFVTYFPHLVAGPVLHHSQMMPQFADRSVYRLQPANFVAGTAIFCLGLFKKIVLADGVSPFADAVFGPVDAGQVPSRHEAWLAALAYTLQLYFDFSGYSDMAVGLSWMFNIRLPFNFNSPYRASSIAEFWRRWHMSLSTFLRDYLYVALGGNRRGPVRRYVNLGLTMVLGGLWHGASWLFVVWGALHGLYLMINHGFRAACDRLGYSSWLASSRVFGLLAWSATMLAVVVAWVFFRSHTLDGALRILASMAGIVSDSQGVDALLWNAGLRAQAGLVWCAALGLAAVLLPNSNTIGERTRLLCGRSPEARWAVGAAASVSVLFLLLVNSARESVSAFIYFNF